MAYFSSVNELADPTMLPPKRTIISQGGITVPPRSDPAPPALRDRATDDLRFIRTTMERAGSFTSVSGVGMMLVGVVGLGAFYWSRGLRADRETPSFLAIWLASALTASVISWMTIRSKAERTRQSLASGPARTFALAFAPSLLAGAILTAALAYKDLGGLLPATWLTLYGAAVAAGGAASVRPVLVMGASFMVLGAVAFMMPIQLQSYALAAGFGGLHLLFGTLIWKRYGG